MSFGRNFLSLLAVTTIVSGCNRGDRAERAGIRALPPDSLPPVVVQNSDADHEYLRKMRDHHEGLTLIAHAAVDRMEGAEREEAQLIDLRHDFEKDRLSELLRKRFGDSNPPQVAPADLIVADSLQRLGRDAYARAFFEWVIRHHRSAIRMIDTYRPLLRDPRVQELADSLRQREFREIEEIQAQSGR